MAGLDGLTNRRADAAPPQASAYGCAMPNEPFALITRSAEVTMQASSDQAEAQQRHSSTVLLLLLDHDHCILSPAFHFRYLPVAWLSGYLVARPTRPCSLQVPTVDLSSLPGSNATPTISRRIYCSMGVRAASRVGGGEGHARRRARRRKSRLYQ